MNRIKWRELSTACAFGIALAHSAVADDIEIYVGADSDIVGVRPNILFILDTSGSMDTNVYTQTIYDPSVTYSGSCNDNYYYARKSTSNVSCGNAQRIPKSLFSCNAALSALESIGFYQDRLAQHKPATWLFGIIQLTPARWEKNINTDDRLTECEDDAGVHGETDGSALKYPADGNDGPYTNDTSKDIRWSDYDVHTMYSANYLNWKTTTETIVQTRLEIMQSVFKDTLDSINNVNVGLMRFDRSANGGMVVHEIANLATARNTLKSQIDNMTASGNTPLAETLYEAGQYYAGRAVDFGKNSSPMSSVSGSRSGWTYDSPIEFQCQRNFIVYLTDGEPTSDTGADSKIRNLPGNGKSCSGNCLDEMAEYLYRRDLSSTLAGDQNVISYFIGFATNQNLLNDAARKGGGKYYTADDTAELTTALTQIIAEVLSINTTFTAPAVSVNAFNRTVHLDQLFFTVFKPSERPHWDGNLKRFDLGYVQGNADVQIIDSTSPPQAAVDPNTGFFKEAAVSFWTLADQSPDGGAAEVGGAAGRISLPRNVYTYTGISTDLAGNSTNRFHEDNGLLSKAALGFPGESDFYRTRVLQWARGVDVFDQDDDGSTTDGRRGMGDPLHSKPVVITYGGTIEDPDITVFMTTNDGFLHAIDADDGAERFAFIPKELWGNLGVLYNNNAGIDSKVYGLDSPITPWVYDVNRNGVIEEGDHVYIYFGQRRGGGNYYALDVTDRNNPRFKWRISSETAGFEELGQSWSQPRLARVRIGEDVKDVLIFGGGYDPDQDSADIYTPDDQGRAVFMVDASTGALLWRAGPSGSGANLVLSDLKNSIPSTIRVIDLNADGLADRMYVGDTGGRLFRFDIINGQNANNLVRGGMIAALGGSELASPTALNSRKFFHPPDASLVLEDGAHFINLAIGSGNQDHPLGSVTQDRLFSVRDYNVRDVPANYTLVEIDDLYDATDNLVQDGDADERTVALTAIEAADGWYIDLENPITGVNEGEKSLSEATTIQGKILYTTFTPVSASQATNCAPSQGIARVYQLDARFATAVQEINNDDVLDREDRAIDLVRGGIPPEVTILFPQATDGRPLAFVGPERVPVDLENEPVRTFWIENGKGE